MFSPLSILYSAGVPVPSSLTDPKCPVINTTPIIPDNQPRGQCPVVNTTQIIPDNQSAGKCPVIHQPQNLPSEPTLGDRTRAALCRGGFASILTTMVTGVIWHPVMTVMVRQQFAGAVDGVKQYRGVTDAVKNIYREGVRAFYRGLTPRLLQSPLAAVQWTTYEMFRDVVSHRYNSTLAAAKYAALFVGSRVLVTTVKCPFEILKERMQVSGAIGNTKILNQSTWQNLKTLVAHDGFRGLFHGLPTNIMRDLPVVILMMTGNDFYTHLLTTGSPLKFWSEYFRNDRKMREKGKVRNPLIDLGAGALSGATASVLTQPIDVAKTIMQTQSMAKFVPAAADGSTNTTNNNNNTGKKYTGMFDVLRKTRAQFGWKFWFTGLSSRAAHIMLGGSVYLMCYRRLQKFLTTGLQPRKDIKL